MGRTYFTWSLQLSDQRLFGVADQISLIRQRNQDLLRLSNGGRMPNQGSGPPNPPATTPLIEYHQRVQRHAKLLYSMLREKLEPPSCKCGVPHSAHLELEERATPPPTRVLSESQEDRRGPSQFFTFSVMLSTQQKGYGQLMEMWQELQLEPINGRSSREITDRTKSPTAIQIPPSSSLSSIASTRERPPPQFLSLPPMRYVCIFHREADD